MEESRLVRIFVMLTANFILFVIDYDMIGIIPVIIYPYTIEDGPFHS